MLHVTPPAHNLRVVENVITETKDIVREAQLAWLRDVLRQSKMTQTALAKKIGRDASTLSKFLSPNARAGHTLSSDIIAGISRVTGIAAVDQPAVPMAPRGFQEPDAAPFRADAHRQSDVIESVMHMVTQKNSVDAWTMQSRALETIGIMPGDILMVDLNATARAGDTVCAQIYDWPQNQARTVFRLYESPFLVAATSDRALMRPELVDQEKVIILGVVVATLRPRQAAA